MGFRCPRCKMDFGNDRVKLWEHFEEYEMCRYEASEIFIERLNQLPKTDRGENGE